MATQFVPNRPQERGPVVEPHGHERTGGSLEALCSAAGIVLAIIGLAGAAARWLDPITTIVLGAAFLFERWTVATREHEGEAAGPIGAHSLSAESLAGWAGVVLGILALVRVLPTVLVPIALIVFGVGLAMGAGLLSRSLRVIIGVAAIVLGILALIGFDPRTLTLIGFIGIGGALLLTGPVVAWRGGHLIHGHAGHAT